MITESDTLTPGTEKWTGVFTLNIVFLVEYGVCKIQDT